MINNKTKSKNPGLIPKILKRNRRERKIEFWDHNLLHRIVKMTQKFMQKYKGKNKRKKVV